MCNITILKWIRSILSRVLYGVNRLKVCLLSWLFCAYRHCRPKNTWSFSSEENCINMFAIQLDERNVRDTVKLFYSLGFIALPEKSSFVPQHRVTFVGFIIDSTTMTVYPTSEKIEKMIHTCQGLLECPHSKVWEVASTLGLLKSHFPAAKLGPLHFRSLDMDKTEASSLSKGTFDAFMQLFELSRSDLQWWIISAMSLHNP